MTETGRREFLELTGTAAMAALSQTSLQTQPDSREFDAYGLLIGPDGARPEPDGQYFREFDTYQFAYFATNQQNQYWINHTQTAWQRVGCLVQRDNQLYLRRER